MWKVTTSPVLRSFAPIVGEIVILKLDSVTLKVFALGVVGSENAVPPLSGAEATYVPALLRLSITEPYAMIGWSDENVTHVSLRSAALLVSPIAAIAEGP